MTVGPEGWVYVIEQTVSRLQAFTPEGELVGHYLMIPVATKPLSAYSQSADARLARTQNRQRSGNKIEHVVRSGESFWTISRKYGVHHRSLAKWNGMAIRDPLRKGQKLVIWSPGTAPARTAQAGTRNDDNRAPEGNWYSGLCRAVITRIYGFGRPASSWPWGLTGTRWAVSASGSPGRCSTAGCSTGSRRCRRISPDT